MIPYITYRIQDSEKERHNKANVYNNQYDTEILNKAIKKTKEEQ